MRLILLFFIIVPLVEMAVLLAVSDEIGGLSTIGLVVLTAVVGIQILKRQGLSTLLRANQRLNSGELPAQEILEGMMLAASGALLLTPGFLTDALGFVLLTPPARTAMARQALRWGWLQVSSGASGFTVYSRYQQTGGEQARGQSHNGHTTVEGEFSSVEGELESARDTRSDSNSDPVSKDGRD
jgi:UPF0716 protein FxsA